MFADVFNCALEMEKDWVVSKTKYDGWTFRGYGRFINIATPFDQH